MCNRGLILAAAEDLHLRPDLKLQLARVKVDSGRMEFVLVYEGLPSTLLRELNRPGFEERTIVDFSLHYTKAPAWVGDCPVTIGRYSIAIGSNLANSSNALWVSNGIYAFAARLQDGDSLSHEFKKLLSELQLIDELDRFKTYFAIQTGPDNQLETIAIVQDGSIQLATAEIRPAIYYYLGVPFQLFKSFVLANTSRGRLAVSLLGRD